MRTPIGALDCGNSGTTTRLMAGIVAGLPITATFVGDASLSRRPMRRIAKPLEAMGARLELPPHGGLPMVVRGGALKDLVWHSEVASAQVKSAILLAGVVGGVRVTVDEPASTRDHTERMLGARGSTSLGTAHSSSSPRRTTAFGARHGGPSRSVVGGVLCWPGGAGRRAARCPSPMCASTRRAPGFSRRCGGWAASSSFARDHLSGGRMDLARRR